MQPDGYLLDTNAILAIAAGSSRLGKKTKHLVAKTPNLYYSPVSIAELEIKMMLGKMPQVGAIFERLSLQDIKELPLFSTHSLELSRFTQLVGHDPFDRLLIAQATAENLSLITSDRKLIDLHVPWVHDSSI